jgi:hypothetical protein
MKRVSLFAVYGLAIVLLSGCGSSEDESPDPNTQTKQISKPKDSNSPDGNNPAETNSPSLDTNTPTEPKKEITGDLVPKPGQDGWGEGPVPVTPNSGTSSGTSTTTGGSTVPLKIPTPADINKPQTPLQVFQAMDQGLKSLQNTKVSFNMQAMFPEGKGTFKNDSVIKDRNRFRLSYARLVKSPVPHLEEYIATQREGKTVTYGDGKINPGRVVVEQLPDIEELPKSITHYLSSAIASNAKPMEGVYKAAQKKGWTMRVEKKVFDIGVFQRIYMESPKGQALTHRYQFTVNPNEKMPTDVKMEIIDPKGKKNSTVELFVQYAKKDTPVTDEELKISTKVEEFKGMASDADIDKMIEKRKKEEEKKASQKPKGT